MKTVSKFALLICFMFTLSCNANEKKPMAVNTLEARETNPETSKQYIKVALLLDTSNSMDGLIDQAKERRLYKTSIEL